ncbi:hypothetical protein GC176_14555 [bacterium]|nr:hypothetical protein [bacterium]
MSKTSDPRFNPYIVGQITLLLGAISLGLAVLPQELIDTGTTTIDVASATAQSELASKLKPYRAASMAIAIAGLCLGPIGWRREDHPLLPICGMTICGVALFWQWIVLGVVLAVMVICLFVFYFGLGQP